MEPEESKTTMVGAMLLEVELADSEGLSSAAAKGNSPVAAAAANTARMAAKATDKERKVW